MIAVVQRRDAAAPAQRTPLARWLLVEAALLGALADAVLRTASLGAGLTVWVLGIAVTVVVLARRFDVTLNREHMLWLGLAVACAAAFAWRDAELLQLVNAGAIMVALAMFSMSMGSARASAFVVRIRDELRTLVRTLAETLGGAVTLIARDAAVGRATHELAAERLPLIRATVLTLPVVIVLGKLLGAADPVFGRLFQPPDIGIGTAASHLLFAALFAWFGAGWLRTVFIAARRPAGPGLPSSIGMVEVSAVLGSVNVLFGLFVGMQLRWLFGGAAVVRETTGLSVAGYARSGFFELVTVAALVLPILLGTRMLIERDAVATQRHRNLALPILVLLSGIMFSAISRMASYVRIFGLTTDRLYALAFMGWLAAVFACMAVTVLRGRARRFASFTVLSGFATLGILDAASPDVVVARYELGRARTAPIDWHYLGNLSGDAAPIVAASLVKAEPGAPACAAARVLMRRYQHEMPFELASFNVGRREGRDVVLGTIKPHSLRRLCAFSTTSPSASSPQ